MSLMHQLHHLSQVPKHAKEALEEGGMGGGAKMAVITGSVAAGVASVVAAPVVVPLAIGAAAIGGLIGAFGKKLK